jgi:hypothetical protein
MNDEWEQIAAESGATNPHQKRQSKRTKDKSKAGAERYDVERWILAKYWHAYNEGAGGGGGASTKMRPAAPETPGKLQPQLTLSVDEDPTINTDSVIQSIVGGPVTDDQPQSVIRKQGWLQLQKKKRYVVLTDFCLAYFQSEAEGHSTMANLHTFHASIRAKGVLDVGSITDVRLVMDKNAATISGGAPHAAFELTMGRGREEGRYVLGAENHGACVHSSVYNPTHVLLFASWQLRVSHVDSSSCFWCAATSLAWVKAVQGAVQQSATPQMRTTSSILVSPQTGSKGEDIPQREPDREVELEPEPEPELQTQDGPSIPATGLEPRPASSAASGLDEAALAFADDVEYTLRGMRACMCAR